VTSIERDPRTPGIPAIVFGEGVTALGVVRALRSHGIPTYLVAPRRALAARSREIIVLSNGWSVRRSGDALRSFLATTDLNQGVLIPCEDDWATAVSDLGDRDEGPFKSSMPSSSVVGRFLDKGDFARTLEELDIERPRTFEIRSAKDLEQIDDDELTSFFLKPRDSQRFVQQFHKKALSLTERRQATRDVERALDGGHELLAQELVSGPPQNHVFIDGFVDRRGHFVGLLARRRIRMFPPRFGNSTDTVTVPLAEVADALDCVRRLFAGVGYRGMFDAEFKRDGPTGRHKIIEVNVRPWWQIELARAAGIDVVHMAYMDALGADVQPAPGYRIGRRWVHTFPDLRARWEGPGGARPETGSREGWFSARHAVFRWSDPRPGLAEIARVAHVAIDLGIRRRH
jgi:predicted ATP-grasp superfamily ATP-dependent carboligase